MAPARRPASRRRGGRSPNRALPALTTQPARQRDRLRHAIDFGLAGAALGYLEKLREQIAYARFRALGLPIGSGMVESANKNVVEQRLKGAGMHCERGA
jgi:hypothetical protein